MRGARVRARKARTAPRQPSKLEALLASHIHAAGLPQPSREHRALPPRRWRLDFAWPARRVACEVEGGGFVGGRHTRGAGFRADCEKYNEHALAGWLVLRVTDREIRSGQALRWIQEALG